MLAHLSCGVPWAGMRSVCPHPRPHQLCIVPSTQSASLGQQVPNHCICQVSSGSPSLGYGRDRGKGRREVPPSVFPSVPPFYLGDFSPGSLHGTETETLCGRCGKRLWQQRADSSLFSLRGTPLLVLAVGRLRVSTFSPPTSLPAPPLPARRLFSFDGHLIV